MFLFVSLSEPDSPPENLTVEDTSPSTVTLTWSKPERANGVIQYYEVLYDNATFAAAMNTTSNRVTLTSLKPFSSYNVSVRAYTRYGYGNQTSNTLYLLSGEDGGILQQMIAPFRPPSTIPTTLFHLQFQEVLRTASPMSLSPPAR